MTLISEKKSRRATNRSIPSALLYEQWQGKPIYYKGYRDVLAGKKTLEEIKLRSDLQGVLVALITGILGSSISRKKYISSINSGLKLTLNDNLANDVAIFEKEKLKKLQGKYFDIAPKIVIEVDTKADVADFPNKLDEYIMRKSQKLIDFGVERVLWIITSLQKVYVIDRNDPTWYVVNWSETISVVDNCTLNIKQLLDDEEIVY